MTHNFAAALATVTNRISLKIPNFFYLVIAVVLSSYVFLSIIPYLALLVLTYSIGYVSFLSWLYAGCGHHYYFILQCGMMMEMNSYFFPFSFLVHPSCMDYSEKLIKKIVQLSTWQCTNCKTCQECHEANDDVSAGMGRAYMIFKSRCLSFMKFDRISQMAITL